MSALGHLGRAAANGLLGAIAWVAGSLLLLGQVDARHTGLFALGLAVFVLLLSVSQSLT